MTLEQAIASLEGTGLYTVALPFLLVFAIVFGLLTQLGLFGDKSREVNAVIGVVIASYAVTSPTLQGLGAQFIDLYGRVGILLIVALTTMVALALAGVTPEKHGRAFGVMGAVLGLAVLVIAAQTGVLAELGVTSAAVSVPDVSGETLATAAIAGVGIGGVAYTVRGRQQPTV